MLLLLKINLIAKKLSYKKYTFKSYSFYYFKIILVLPTKVITLYIQVIIIEIKIFGLEWPIARREICLKLAVLLVLDK